MRLRCIGQYLAAAMSLSVHPALFLNSVYRILRMFQKEDGGVQGRFEGFLKKVSRVIQVDFKDVLKGL